MAAAKKNSAKKKSPTVASKKAFYTKQRQDAMKGKYDVAGLKGADSPMGQKIESKLVPKTSLGDPKFANKMRYASSQMRKGTGK